MSERDVKRALEGPANEPPRAVDLALNSLAEPRRGYLVKTWIGTSRGTNGRTKVTFVWEPTRGNPGEATTRRACWLRRWASLPGPHTGVAYPNGTGRPGAGWRGPGPLRVG